MIIPIRCVSCGKVLANKWLWYEQQVKEMEESGDKNSLNNISSDLPANFNKNLKGHILDKLYLDRLCCRTTLLTHKDVIDTI